MRRNISSHKLSMIQLWAGEKIRLLPEWKPYIIRIVFVSEPDRHDRKFHEV